jgi:hypothetical protein
MENEAKKALQDLLSSAKDRSAMARLREVYPEIETAQKAGIHLETILAALNERGGFDLTLKTFKTMLYRIRKNDKQRSPGAKSGQENQVQKDSDNRLTPKEEGGPTEEGDDNDNPFMKLSKQSSTGDVRRNEFTFNPTPDKSKIYRKE